MALEELKAVLRYRKVSYRELAPVLGVQVSTFSRKINEQHGSEFSRSEIVQLAEYLHLDHDEVRRLFFAQ